MREGEREREKTSKKQVDYASAIRDQCYVIEPIETNLIEAIPLCISNLYNVIMYRQYTTYIKTRCSNYS